MAGQFCPTHTVKSLSIKYTLPQTGKVRISLYDVSGRLVKNLVDDVQKPGAYTRSCDTGDLGLSRGVYFVRLETDDRALVQKAIVVR
ncbi:MAG TPA: T9SS type A sorting domain-containing protein [bacterium]